MFTKEGDDRVLQIIVHYRKKMYKKIILHLFKLSNKRGFLEASDTEVRDKVYNYLNNIKLPKNKKKYHRKNPYFGKNGYLKQKYKKNHLKQKRYESIPLNLLL